MSEVASTLSARAQAAWAIAAFADTNGLSQVYAGGGPKRTTHNRRVYYSVLLCRARILDAAANVYGERFVEVVWRTAIRTMPASGREVFASAGDAIAFLRAAFVDFNPDAAASVPRRIKHENGEPQ